MDAELNRILARAHELIEMGTYLIDPALRTIRLSTEAALLLRAGTGPLELTLDEYRNRFYYPEELSPRAAQADRAYAAGLPFRIETRVRRGDGASIWVRASSSLERDAQGKPLIVGVMQDITQQKDAQKNQRLLASILEQTSDAVLVVDRQGILIEWNRGAEMIFGYSAEEALGRSGSFLSPSDEPGDAFVERKMQQVRQGPMRYEEARTTKDGRVVHLDISTTPLKDESGQVIGYSAICRDITEKLKAQENQRLLASILEQIPDAVILSSSNDTILQWNRSAERIFGYTADEVVGKGAPYLGTSDNANSVRKMTRELSTKGGLVSYEAVRQRKDGQWIDVSAIRFPLKDSRGKPLGMVGIVRDITEQKRALESQRVLSLILEQSPDGVILSDLNDITREWNKGAEKIFGYTAEEMLGRPGSVTEAPGRTGEIEMSGLRLLEGHEAINYETVRKRKDGRSIDVSVTRFRLKDDGGNVIGFVGIIRDITARKTIEAELAKHRDHLEQMVATRTEELQKAIRAAEAANEAKSSFLANMSHEIRTPMNAILGFAQLLRRDEALSESQTQQVDVILRSGSQLLALINDILDYSKVEANRLPVVEADLDLSVLLAELRSMFQARADEKGIRLVVESANDGPAFIVSDETKLRQILQNLISNAVKFTERGSVVLRVSIQRERNDAAKPRNLRLVAHVQDTGHGIASEELGSLFKIFEQTESGRRTRAGTGLGLAISRKFAELLGGSLDVEWSQVGKGSIFRLDVPIGEGREVRASERPRRVLGLEPGQPQWRVLVVDDNAENRGYLDGLLTVVGFQVTLAEDGAAGVAAFKAFKPHLILMDLRMPVMDGPEAIRAIRSLDGGDAVKILAVSASVFGDDRTEAIAVGADDFEPKPFREEAFFAKLEALLGLKYRYGQDPDGGDPSGPPSTASSTEGVTKLPQELKVPLSQLLHGLPAELLNALREATIRARPRQLEEICARLAEHSAEAADALREAIAGFRYDLILSALSTGPPRS